MSDVRSFLRSFNGGVVTPEFWGQIADQKFQTGLAVCENFEVLPHGPVQNRPGFAFVRAAKHADRRVRLIPFTYSTTQTFVLEFGHQYVRFHTQGATLESSPGVAYEKATSYDEVDLFDLHYVQSADVLTIVHPSYAPTELRRLGPLTWTLTTISFASPLTPPAVVSAAATVGSGSITYEYKVTAVGADGLQQSLASPSASVTNNLLTSGNKNTVTWTPVTDAVRYWVYKRDNGLYGYIGQTDTLSFTDENIAADIATTPPEASNPFNAPGNYPGAVSYFEQRRVFAGTVNAPQNFWMTRSGTESDLTYSIPNRDDDAVTARVVAREANTILHAVPLADLMFLTTAAEWRADTSSMPPSVKPQSYIGASTVPPVVVNNNLIFAAARGGHLRELAFNQDFQGYVTGDLSLRAPHLFDALDLVDLSYTKSPHPVVWAVSTSGKLLGLTYVPEQQVAAWHEHATAGRFESIAAVAEGAEDMLYAVVQREINGATVRYIEIKRSRQFAEQADAFFVDCGGTYDGAPTTTVTGLTWLEGETVNILADGGVHAQRVVSGGQITLDQPASRVQVGLPIRADMQTLPMAFDAGGFGQGRLKNVAAVWLRVYRSSGIFAGPSFDNLAEHKQRTTEPYGTPPALRTDEIELRLPAAWQSGGQVCIRQTAPLPLTITGLAIEAAVGG
jgi:hypothetical protein